MLLLFPFLKLASSSCPEPDLQQQLQAEELCSLIRLFGGSGNSGFTQVHTPTCLLSSSTETRNLQNLSFLQTGNLVSVMLQVGPVRPPEWSVCWVQSGAVGFPMPQKQGSLAVAACWRAAVRPANWYYNLLCQYLECRSQAKWVVCEVAGELGW